MNFKFIFILIAVIQLLGTSDISQAKDSSNLATETVMKSSISTASSYVPVGSIITWPFAKAINDADKYMECDGSAVPKTSDLYKEYGITHTPNMVNKFLRGSESNVGASYADSLRSHAHQQPTHSHAVDGKLTSGTIAANVKDSSTKGTVTDTTVETTGGSSGGNLVAAPGTVKLSAVFMDGVGGIDISGPRLPDEKLLEEIKGSTGKFSGNGVYGHGDGNANLYIHNFRMASPSSSTGGSGNLVSNATTGNLNGTKVVGSVADGDVSITLQKGGDVNTYFTSMLGGTATYGTSVDATSETAPQHMRVRYLIRINR